MGNVIEKSHAANSLLINEDVANDKSGVKQIHPGTSIQESVKSALIDIKQGALSEAMEDASFALGGRLRDLKAGKDKSRSELEQNKEALDKLIKQINAVDPVQLTQLAAKYPGVLDASDPLAFMQQKGATNAEIVLILGFILMRGGLSSAQRKRLKKALQDTLEQSDVLGIDLFTFLEFGPATGEITTQLTRIYQKACDGGLKLNELFMKLKGLPDRNRKLKTLIRGLAFELSCQGKVAQGNKLASVIVDLRKLLLFFGLGKQCEHIASVISELGAPLTGIQVIEELILMIDQAWLYSDWLDSRMMFLGLLEQQTRLAYLRRLQDVITNMPDPCFSDEDQRETILEVCLEVQGMYADTP
ncbi:TyeA family type III secretion system gatekeeper subunit [Vibrio sp. S4M6]|uniref:TyeA family type III secretion system gatekeeper subunit n=1 Tax=Vibrio sinus TaxID=2946865 RepID=UPI002029C5B5|nr:TyeA family type III secretion system gatekeeper subunit [Vibrio sinus]MCL9783732.1 TyeA family type III secretion system gatekeeper subunit [Vibrio sinus]